MSSHHPMSCAPAVFCAAVAAAAALTRAAVSTDGSVGPARSLQGPNFAVTPDLGKQVGGNLFHSFRQFDLAKGEAATFTGPASVHTVLTRVTGGTASQIDGTIRCTIPNADFYLVTPAGAVFGPDAALDVQGSFAVTTANYLRLADGGRFAATANPADSVLTTAAPAAFGFLGPQPPAVVVVNGSSLRVHDGATLTAAGGPIRIAAAGRITAPGGVALVAAGGPGEVGVGTAGAAAVDATGLPRRADIFVKDGSLLNADGPGGGHVVLRGANVTLDTSSVSSRTLGGSDGAGIDAAATGTLSVTDGSIATGTAGSGAAGPVALAGANIVIRGVDVAGSSVSTASAAGAAGRAGDVRVEGGALQLVDGSSIETTTHGPGAGGAIVVTANAVTIDNPSSIDAGMLSRTKAASGGGLAGRIHVATGRLDLRGGSAVVSASTGGGGDGGAVTVEATGDVKVAGDGGIFSQANSGSAGRAGNVRVEAETLTLEAGGEIGSDTSSTGDAGTVTVVVRGRLSLEGSAAPNLSTGILGRARPGSTGRAGSVMVEAGALDMRGGAQLGSPTSGAGAGGAVAVKVHGVAVLDGAGSDKLTGIVAAAEAKTGRAGDVRIEAETLVLRDRGKISSDTSGTGNAGSVTVLVQNHLSLDGTGSDLSTGISSDTNSQADGGRAGDVIVRAGSVKLKGGALISSDSFGIGHGGNVSVVVRNQLTLDGTGSDFSTGISSDSVNEDVGGSAGKVAVSAGTAKLIGGAVIASGIFGLGNGGDVSVRVGRKIVIDGSKTDNFTGISANSEKEGTSGKAGTVSVEAPLITLRDGAGISSDSSGDGSGGDVTVQGNRIRVASGSFMTTAGNGKGPAGTLFIKADRVLSLSKGGSLETDAANSTGGNLRVVLHGTMDIDDGLVTTVAGGNGGNIVIDPTAIVMGPGSLVSANGGANGGNVTMTADTLLINRGIITATGRTGVSGRIALTPPDTQLSGSLVGLPAALASGAAILAPQCGLRLGGDVSSFLLAGRGGEPPRPGGWTPDAVMDDGAGGLRLVPGTLPMEPRPAGH